MSTKMTAELRAALLEGIANESWGDDFKVRMRFELAHLNDGDEVPMVPSFSFPAIGPEVPGKTVPAVAAMIEHFGLNNVE